MLQRDVSHLCGRRHFHIQWQVNFSRQSLNIRIADVTSVFAQMRGNAIGSALCGNRRRAHWVGQTAPTGISDGCHMVDIYA